jgi:hypothetical protein
MPKKSTKKKPAETVIYPTVPPREQEPKYCWKEVSDYPERDVVATYANAGRGPGLLPSSVKLAVTVKCDPEHLQYDSRFAEIFVRQAKAFAGLAEECAI